MNTQTKRKTLYTAYNNLCKDCKRLDLKVSDAFRKRAIECLHKMSDKEINEQYKLYKQCKEK